MNGLVRQEYSFIFFRSQKSKNPPTLLLLKCIIGISLVIWWLGLCTSTAGGRFPGWGTKSSHDKWQSQTSKNKMHYVSQDSQIVVFSIFLMGHQTDPQMEVILSVFKDKKGTISMYFYFCHYANVGAISSILGQDLLKPVATAVLGSILISNSATLPFSVVSYLQFSFLLSILQFALWSTL